MSTAQMLLIALGCAFCKMEGGWFGECKFRQPIFTGFLVGLILGNVSEGLKVGAEFELIWMGTAGIGPVAHLDITTGGILGAAVAVSTGQGVEAGMLFALPASMMMQMVENVTMTVYSTFNVMAEKAVTDHKFNNVMKIHLGVGLCNVVLNFCITFAALLFSNAVASAVANGLPGWLESGLGGVAAILPSFGFAMLLSIMMDTELVPFFMIGFVVAAYSSTGTAYTMIGIGALGLAIAWIFYIVMNKVGTVSTASAGDEWED